MTNAYFGSSPETDEILVKLEQILDPNTGQSVVRSGMVQGINVTKGIASIALEINPQQASSLEPLRQAIEQAAMQAPSISKAVAIFTASSEEKHASSKTPPNLQQNTRANPAQGDKPLRAPERNETGPILGVSRVIAIASGKGGVGKSTVSANLAVALAAQGWKVGLLDADVYGPSQPRMLGIHKRPASPDGQHIIPLENHGVKLMSIGLLAPEDEAIIWRGPMLMGALQQMLRQVQWGELDVLLIDLPPGTGDVQLTLAQKAEVTGAIIVSTPQDIALIDAKKAINMFEKTKIPLLGVIENMSGYLCPNCGHEAHIFGQGGAQSEAERVGAPFLGAIPLNLDIRVSGDSGTPIVASRPESAQATAFAKIAIQIKQR